MNQYIEAFNVWYRGLQSRERLYVITTAIVLVITLFYISVWEPVFDSLEQQQQQYQSQQDILSWMQTAAIEARTLKQSGARPNTNTSRAVSLIVEQSATSSGMKKNISKLESSGKDDVRVILDAASFDQMLIWLNTLEQQHGVSVASANIERTDKPGTINARLSFKRS